MKKDIKKEIDEIGSTIDWIEREELIFFKTSEIQFLQIKTLAIIAKQNEKMINVLNKINHNIIRTIDPSR